MKVIHGIRADLLPASVITLGMFDGVHRGHQALLASCRRHADRLGLPAVALTYAPHPSQVLFPDKPVRLLTLLPEKIDCFAHHAMDAVVIAEFTHAFSLLPAESFIGDIIATALHARVVVVGYRTTFGHARGGTAELLHAEGSKLGFTVDVVEPVEVAGAPVSSSRIRACLDEGDVALAAELLGYRYQLTGMVLPGDQRGRTLGFPTANLDISAEKILPADGVYVVDACVPGTKCRGAMFIGNRATFARPRSVEIHLLDFAGDLYNQPLTVTFLARMREVRSFASTNELIKQIRQDVAQAAAYNSTK